MSSETLPLPASIPAQPANLAPNAFPLPRTNQLAGLLTIIRDKNTQRGDFIFYSDRIIRILVEFGLNHLPVVEKTVTTPTGLTYNGVGFEGKICGISIMRAGESMEAGLRECCRAVRIGKILIQRDEETALAKLFYAKLPDDIASRYCLLLDPMLATGGSAIKAVEVLISHGVPEQRIIFLNLVASPEGLQAMYEAYPQVKVITAWVDEGLNEQKYIVPGLGDFGDRPLFATPAFLFKAGAAITASGMTAGALGAHALGPRLGEKVATWHTASNYAIFNGVALLALSQHPAVIRRWSGPSIVLGTVMFSGSIFALLLAKGRLGGFGKVLGPMTPVGGMFMIGGYLSLLF